jgi:hypothetical protein
MHINIFSALEFTFEFLGSDFVFFKTVFIEFYFLVDNVVSFWLIKVVCNALSLLFGSMLLFFRNHLKCLISNSVCSTKEPHQKSVRAKLHATSFWNFKNGKGFLINWSKILSYCTDVENGVGDAMIHLLGAIMKTCSFAGINSNLNSLVITFPKSNLPCNFGCLSWQKCVVPYFWHYWISWKLLSRNWKVVPTAIKSLFNFGIIEDFGLWLFEIRKKTSWNRCKVLSGWTFSTWVKMFIMLPSDLENRIQ